MTRKQSIIVKAAGLLLVVWAVVFGIRSYASSKKITADSLNREIASLDFADWSQEAGSGAEANAREKDIRRVADMVNRLDFREREKSRDDRTAEKLFTKLSPNEKMLFIDLTIVESMSRFMEALDEMPEAQRRQFVEKGLQEINSGRTAEEMNRALQIDENLLGKIGSEGMRAYFDKASAETKMDLAPLMEAMNEVMQGLRGREFGQ